MIIDGVEEVQASLHHLGQRIAANIDQFEALLSPYPVLSLGQIDRIATDRGRQLHLELLLSALCGDWDTWTAQTLDERMRGARFQRVSPHHPLYLRLQSRTTGGVELCDRFSTIHIELAAVAPLIAALQRSQARIAPAPYGRERFPVMN